MSADTTQTRALWSLFGCQALFMSTAILTTTLASVAATDLLGNASLATLPQATIPLVAMLMSMPAAILMRRYGRRSGFRIGAATGVASGIVCSLALVLGSYSAFLAGTALLGVYQAFATYYRFAVADAVAEDRRARSVSFVLAGGVAAALLGPTLGASTAYAVPGAPYLGSYLATIGLNVLAIVLLSLFDLREAEAPVVARKPAARRRLTHPRFLLAAGCCAIGQGVMMLVMTATPLAMLAHGHSLGFASLVISWHVLAMFLPSFFSGPLIDRLGLRPVLVVGLTLLGLSAMIAIAGTERMHFATALVLSGLGWNALFVGGSTLLTGIADPDERARVQGTNEVLTFGTTAVATFASGALYFGVGWPALNAVAIGAIGVLAVLLLALGHRPFEDEPAVAGSRSRADESIANAASETRFRRSARE